MHTTEWDRAALRTALDAIMEKAELSQTAVGELAGRDRTMANRWLSGKHQPNYEAAARFAAAIAQQRPDLADLARQFMIAAGYGDRISGSMTALLPPLEASPTGTSDVLRQAVQDLRARAEAEGRPLAELLVEEGIVTPDELVVPDGLKPDPIIEEINASDLSPETKARMIRIHLDNRAQHFERARLERKKLDG
ncbi:helix-turn-helix domain-containing protein [Streptosporangium sp. V21-05]|uniref:helix-turn-helix domain-containing protein n=1 Tax=Streptosporangium sp. V21-05 TaxID=3446115 RepID=UPI003F52A137